MVDKVLLEGAAITEELCSYQEAVAAAKPQQGPL